MKKSYAQSVDASVGRGWDSSQHSSRAPSQAGGELPETPSKSPGPKSGASTPAETSKPGDARAALVAELTSIQNAKDALPQGDTYDAIRTDLDAKIKAQKVLISKSNPPNTQLENVLKAMERSQSRRAAAAAALAKAQKDIEDEDLNMAKLEADKTEIEAFVVSQQLLQPSLGSQPAPITAVASSLQALVSHARGQVAMTPEALAFAESQLQAILGAMEVPDADEEGNPTKRLRSKQTGCAENGYPAVPSDMDQTSTPGA